MYDSDLEKLDETKCVNASIEQKTFEAKMQNRCLDGSEPDD